MKLALFRTMPSRFACSVLLRIPNPQPEICNPQSAIAAVAAAQIGFVFSLNPRFQARNAANWVRFA